MTQKRANKNERQMKQNQIQINRFQLESERFSMKYVYLVLFIAFIWILFVDFALEIDLNDGDIVEAFKRYTERLSAFPMATIEWNVIWSEEKRTVHNELRTLFMRSFVQTLFAVPSKSVVLCADARTIFTFNYIWSVTVFCLDKCSRSTERLVKKTIWRNGEPPFQSKTKRKIIFFGILYPRVTMWNCDILFCSVGVFLCL